MNKVDQDIRSGSFSRAYLLYGDEPYLKEYYLNRLIRAVIPEEDTMNLNVYREPPVDVPDLIGQAQTMPFFAEHRLIVVTDSGLFKAEGQELAEALPSFPEETVIVFSEKEVDARGKLYKTVKDMGVLLKLDHPKQDELTSWIVKRLDKNGRKIQRSAMQLFLERIGDDMNLISNELEKLISYTCGKDAIMLEDVQELTIRQLDSRIFEMTDAIAVRDQVKALAVYDELIAQREAPLKILSALSTQFIRLLEVKDLRAQGLDIQTISDKLKIKFYPARIYVGQSERFAPQELRRSVELIAQTDADIKSGRMEQVKAVQLVIVRIAGGV